MERLRFGLFIAVVVSAYFLSAGILVRKLLGRPHPFGREARWFHWVILGLAALGTLCIAYGFLIEPYWPQVTQVRIASPKSTTGFPDPSGSSIFPTSTATRARDSKNACPT